MPLAAWQDLMERMKRAHFGVILFGMGLTMTRGAYLNSEAVLALVRDMNAYTRFVAKPMRRPGNVTGADNVSGVADRLSVRRQSVAGLSAVQPGRIHGQRDCSSEARPTRP